MRTRTQALLGWLPPLIWMGLIFVGSGDTLSGAHTSRFIEPFLRWLFQGRLSVTAVEGIHLFIRKCGHLTEYAVLAVLLWNALRLSALAGVATTVQSGGRRLFVQALALTAIYAASDEFHQSFVPSRTASVRDVLIDTVGGSAGLLVLWAALRLRRHWAARSRHPDKS